MAKQSGLGDQLYVAGYDLGGDVSAVSKIHGGPAPWDVTDITQSAHSRIGLLRDGGLDFTAYFNPSSNRAHPRLSVLPTSDAIVSYFSGSAIGNQAACTVAKQVNYDGTRGNDGSLTFEVSAMANGYGLEWGNQLTPGIRADTTPTNGASFDTTASASFGWTAWLHVFSFTGTSCAVAIQDSSDNASFATLAGAGFTAAAGVTSERLNSSSATATVRRYIRAVTTGTFTQCSFAVVFTKPVAVSSVY